MINVRFQEIQHPTSRRRRRDGLWHEVLPLHILVSRAHRATFLQPVGRCGITGIASLGNSPIVPFGCRTRIGHLASFSII